jgi:hypothetical protein
MPGTSYPPVPRGVLFVPGSYRGRGLPVRAGVGRCWLARRLTAVLLAIACFQAGCTPCAAMGDEYCEEVGYEDWKAFRGWWRGPIDLAEDALCMSELSDLFLVDAAAGTLGFRVDSGSYPALTYEFQGGGCEFDGEVSAGWATVANPADSHCVEPGLTLTIRACVGCGEASEDDWQAGSLVVEGPGGCAGHYEFDAESQDDALW